MDAEKARIATSLLERVVNGEIGPAEALAQWPQTDKGEKLLNVAWHDLSHFSADEDIRRKDARYAEYQIALLKKRVAEIREVYDLP